MNTMVARRPRTLGTRHRSGSLLVAVAAMVAAALAWTVVTGDDGSPIVVSRVAEPESYRIVYETEFADSPAFEEVLQVQRPFRSRLDNPTNSRSSDLGELVTGGEDGAVRIQVPIVPAGDDVRPSAVIDAAIDAGHLELLGTDRVAGRACRMIRFGGPVASGFLVPVGTEPDEFADVCIDGAGLVLSESWSIDGEVVRTRRAVEVTTGIPRFDTLEADRELAAREGGGAVRPTAAEEDPGFAEYWVLPDVPAGFEHLGRWAVVPPDPDLDATPGEPRVPGTAFVTDVWTRGGDIVILDQGAAVRGDSVPFDDRALTEQRRAGALGEVEVVWDLRMSEVRSRRDDGGFVRVAGTLPPDQLVAIAATLRLEP